MEMNIVAISDTHGNIARALELIEQVRSFAEVDLIVHCGDLVSDAAAIGARTGIDVVSVYGNCDGCYDRDYKIVEVPSGRLLVTHGHAEGVKYGLMQLGYLAKENNCNAVCYGHTHIASIDKHDGITLINPGSAARPRDGLGCSCALISSSTEGLVATFLR